MHSPKKANYKMGKDRLEFFSDGVLAIAITLLVIEIKVPNHEAVHKAGSLYNALLELWPRYLAYFITFIQIGVYWSNHHWYFSFMKKTNHVFNLLNVLFLMTIAFMPFTTAVFGDYINDSHLRNAAVTVYCIGFLLPLPMLIIMTLYSGHNNRLVHPQLQRSFLNELLLKLSAGLVMMIVAVALSFSYPMISLGLIGILLLIYLLPPTPPRYDEHVTVTGEHI